MLINKIRFRLKNLFSKISVKKPAIKVNLSGEFIFLAVITSLLVFWLLSSIYSSIIDIRQYKILEDEQNRLNELGEENEKLIKEKDFYKSEYYQRLYAREALNMAEGDQELYEVERNEEYDYESFSQNLDPIDVSKYSYWWKKLIF